ncbi:MAG: IS630 family transposase [Bacteroidales bacterium]|nr:IS630 family transposase [Bacteroidales bacterium]
MEKIDLRRASKEEKEAIRIRAIHMHTQKLKQNEIAFLLGVHKNSVYQWIKLYNKYGKKGLKEVIRGRKKGTGRLLSREQEKEIQKMITDKMPDQLKLPYALWTRKAIRDLIKRTYKVEVAIRTMGDYLNEWGFSPQKPKKKAYEQNSKSVNKWLKEEYPSIVKKAKKEGAEIHWGDETGIRNTSQYGRSYAPKGQTPVKETMAKRISLNMISTITNQGKVRFMTYKGTMNSQQFIIFMKRLIKGAEKKIFLILDNLKVHHSKLVKKWVEKNKNKIELFYLPSYSPELNPDEYLNNDLKSGIGLKASPKNEKQMNTNVKSHMIFLQRNPERVARFFHHKSIKYAAA